MDKSLLFFILAIVCFWLVLDEIYGKKYISNFISSIMSDTKAEE